MARDARRNHRGEAETDKADHRERTIGKGRQDQEWINGNGHDCGGNSEAFETMGNDRGSARTMENDATEAHAASASGKERIEKRRAGKATRTNTEDARRNAEEKGEAAGDTGQARRDFRAYQKHVFSGAAARRQTRIGGSGNTVSSKENNRNSIGGQYIARRSVRGCHLRRSGRGDSESFYEDAGGNVSVPTTKSVAS